MWESIFAEVLWGCRLKRIIDRFGFYCSSFGGFKAFFSPILKKVVSLHLKNGAFYKMFAQKVYVNKKMD